MLFGSATAPSERSNGKNGEKMLVLGVFSPLFRSPLSLWGGRRAKRYRAR
jgi:hypothetical protein